MKKALITGGCRGIGLAAAKKFYENGYLTFITYSATPSDKDGALDIMPYATALKLDVTDSFAVNELFTKHDFDVLVNSAGVSSYGLLTETDDDEFDRVMRVNLYGTFYTCRAAAKAMIKKGSGAIVNVSSVWGLSGGSCEAAYSASKAGVIGLTKALAKELGPSKIRVNAVAPGFIDTKMTECVDPSSREEFALNTPLLRTGSPDEAAEAIYFLGSDLSGFITGEVLKVSGGYAI